MGPKAVQICEAHQLELFILIGPTIFFFKLYRMPLGSYTTESMKEYWNYFKWK